MRSNRTDVSAAIESVLFDVFKSTDHTVLKGPGEGDSNASLLTAGTRGVAHLLGGDEAMQAIGKSKHAREKVSGMDGREAEVAKRRAKVRRDINDNISPGRF